MDKIAVIDFGGQYAHLIANRVRRLGVYADIHLPEEPIGTYKDYTGIILSGGPASVYAEASPTIEKEFFSLGKPILGICYGHQITQHQLGGFVKSGDTKEYGFAKLEIVKDSALLKDMPKHQRVWMSHGDYVEKLAEGFAIIGSTEDCPTAAVANEKCAIYGIQFHAEVTHTEHGTTILKNFIFGICKAKKSWDMATYYKNIEHDIRKKVGDKKVFLLVSGGVDSTVCFTLLNKIIGKENVKGVLIDHGMMRLNEADEVKAYLEKQGFDNLTVLHVEKEFLSELEGITDPETKRKIIGRVFLHVKDQASIDMGLNEDEWILAQGTIYPDTIETGGTLHADTIKTHHNRVDEIQKLIELGKVIEPLDQLYKDEVRMLGELLNIPHDLLYRHPFPGPGLAIRTLCIDKNSEYLGENIELIDNDLWKLPLSSVGVQGDGRTYASPAVITEYMDYDTLENHSTNLTNSRKDLNRVLWCVVRRGKWENYHAHETYLTEKRLDLLRQVDAFVTKRLRETGWYDKTWQCPVVLIPVGDTKESIVLRPIDSKEAMTASFTRIDQGFIVELGEEIVAKFPIDAVFFDVTNKPPGTIEWE